MVLYDFTCEGGHRFEAGVAAMSSPAPPCPSCGAGARRRPAAVRLGGATAGTPREAMPHSWKGVAGGDRAVLDGWRQVVQRREREEQRHPELAGDRRPILAHEGVFAAKPLRAGDDVGAALAAARRTGETTPSTTGASLHTEGGPS